MKGSFDARAMWTVGALLLSTTQAHAQERASLDLRWSAPEGCPSESDVARRAETLIGNTGGGADVRSEARVETAKDGSFELTLAIDQGGTRAKRSLRSRDCAALGEAAAWLIALTIDPSLSQRQEEQTQTASAPEPSAAPKAAAPSPAPKQPSEEPEANDEPATPLERRLRFGIDGGVAAQGLSGPAGSLGAHLGLGLNFSYTELRISHLFERTAEVSPGINARFSSQTLVLAQCFEFGTFVSIAPCLLVQGQRTAGEVEGIVQELENTSYWWLGGAALTGFYRPAQMLELNAGLDLALPVSTRPRFTVDTLEVGEARFVSVSARIGVGVRY